MMTSHILALPCRTFALVLLLAQLWITLGYTPCKTGLYSTGGAPESGELVPFSCSPKDDIFIDKLLEVSKQRQLLQECSFWGCTLVKLSSRDKGHIGHIVSDVCV